MNKLKLWLKAERGRATALAKHLGVEVSRVTQMADSGVPVKHMPAVHAFTGGEISFADMVSHAATGRQDASHAASPA